MATTWRVGNPVTVVGLNADSVDIVALQASAARCYFEQTKAAQTVTSGANTNWGAWTTLVQNGFTWTGTSTGITVPTDGIYAVCHVWQITSGGTFTARSFVEVDLNGTLVYRQNTDSGVGETYISGTVILQCSAGDVVTPTRYQNSGATLSGNCSATLKVARVAP